MCISFCLFTSCGARTVGVVVAHVESKEGMARLSICGALDQLLCRLPRGHRGRTGQRCETNVKTTVTRFTVARKTRTRNSQLRYKPCVFCALPCRHSRPAIFATDDAELGRMHWCPSALAKKSTVFRRATVRAQRTRCASLNARIKLLASCALSSSSRQVDKRLRKSRRLEEPT